MTFQTTDHCLGLHRIVGDRIMQEILDILLKIIEKEGPDYPENNSYPTYLTMLEKGADARKARLVHLTMLAGIPQIMKDPSKDISKEELSKVIQQECCLKSKPADSLSAMYLKLYSPAHLETWSKQRENGFHAFCYEYTWTMEWEGEDTWHSGGGHQDCSASVTAEFEVVDESLARKVVSDLLSKNPFVDEETIWDQFLDILGKALDDALHDTVTSDWYYPPDMEDYDPSYELEECCKKLGLKVLSISCEGSIDDFESDNPRYW